VLIRLLGLELNGVRRVLILLSDSVLTFVLPLLIG
jgi:hypothetical protein